MRSDPRRHDPATYWWSVEIPTRFSDMDPNRHLNNVAIARLFEETRVRFNMELRAAHPEFGRPRYLVGHVGIDYLAEGNYPAPTLMTYGIAAIGTSSFRNAMAMFQNGQCVALAETVMVHRGDAGPSPIPAALRSVLEGYLLNG